MSHKGDSRWMGVGSRLGMLSVFAVAVLSSPQVHAQVPARFYWKTLAGANAVPVIFQSINGNTNPFDSAHLVTPGASFDAVMGLVGYARTLSLFDRAAMAALIEPVGEISGDVTVAGKSSGESAGGFGDPMLEFDINVIGPEAQKDLVDVLRYEPRFSLDILADLALPIGEYDDDRHLNLGQHRWYGRLGLPIVWQLGAWVPGRRTTLEFLPAAWFFSDNHDYVGQTLSTDPMFQLDAHVTRDLTEHFWAAFDASWYYGAKASVDGVEGDPLNNVGVGATLGYQINENLNLTLGYKSTVADNGSGDLQMESFMVSLVAGWHPLIEGARRLREQE